MRPLEKYYENAAETIIKGLKKRQIEGFYCPDKESAVRKVLELIDEGSSIGWGGSMTLTESGLMEALKAAAPASGYDLIDRMKASTPKEVKEMNARLFTSDVFLMSTNAITYDGEMINIDGRGNRIAFLCYGPSKVIILAGMNKVVSDVETGVKRVRNFAAPPNTVRLKKNTPCSTTGRCGDCYATDSICSQILITRRSGDPERIKVVLVGDHLGY